MLFLLLLLLVWGIFRATCKLKHGRDSTNAEVFMWSRPHLVSIPMRWRIWHVLRWHRWLVMRNMRKIRRIGLRVPAVLVLERVWSWVSNRNSMLTCRKDRLIAKLYFRVLDRAGFLALVNLGPIFLSFAFLLLTLFVRFYIFSLIFLLFTLRNCAFFSNRLIFLILAF